MGSAVLRHVLEKARQLGATRATLEVRASNEGARRLYERLGFSVAGVRPNYYSSPVEDALILWRDGHTEQAVLSANSLCRRVLSSGWKGLSRRPHGVLWWL